MESIASNSSHCKKTLYVRSSNSKSSESCNIQHIKRPRTVQEKMAGHSQFREIEEMETMVNETQEPETQSQGIEKRYLEYPYCSDTQGLDTQVTEEESVKRQFEVFEDIDLNNRHIARIIQLTAKVKYQTVKNNITIWEARGLVVQMNKVKEDDIELNEDEVLNVIRYFSYKFESYCREMQRGMRGLTFDAIEGTFEPGNKYSENLHDISCFMADFKHVISHFHLLKCIYEDTYKKHCQCIRKMKSKLRKNKASKLMMDLTGRTSSSSNLMSTSHGSFKSVRKPKFPLQSVKSWFLECPPYLEPLKDRISDTFALESEDELQIFIKIIKWIGDKPGLLEKFKNYDDDKFRDEMITLRRNGVV